MGMRVGNRRAFPFGARLTAMPSRHAVVIPADHPRAGALARRLAAPGLAIVFLAADGYRAAAEEAGRLAAELGPGRAAVFVGDDGLAEFVEELFSGPSA